MSRETNYLSKSVLLTFVLAGLLLLIGLIPEFSIGKLDYKKVSFVSDLFKPEKKPDTTATPVPLTMAPATDTCKQGLVCIKDFSKDTFGLDVFLKALDSAANKQVRIAWFGDSFVEGDICLEHLRDTLQTTFGGTGVGFVPITSEVAGFRQTITHQYSGWHHCAIVGERDKTMEIGFGGSVAVPRSQSSVTYKAVKRQRLSKFENTYLFIRNEHDISIQINDSATLLPGSSKMQKVRLGKNLNELKLSIANTDSAEFYGVSFESTTGIVLDNYAMRGNSGIGLGYIKESMYRQMNASHHPDLIVLQYGLNVASPKSKNYDWYTKLFSNTIELIKRSFPNSCILVVSCPDRGEKYVGEYKTMRGVKELVAAQEALAAKHQVCFWNLFEAMGGDSTMVKWAGMKNRPFANKDYTHLTFYGGKELSNIIMSTLLFEKEKYDKRKPVAAAKPVSKSL